MVRATNLEKNKKGIVERETYTYNIYVYIQPLSQSSYAPDLLGFHSSRSLCFTPQISSFTRIFLPGKTNSNSLQIVIPALACLLEVFV
ncbi:hypothetical protein L6452_40051 [Arctium lappa]|uniref:Uncharacterized protein n=1 Tax=Arctium lappa TaxID=4217 RepID=A0ACB8XTI2_ARCLA|nr:hypothetical protein L6452_40051 [Arctium lappa]